MGAQVGNVLIFIVIEDAVTEVGRGYGPMVPGQALVIAAHAFIREDIAVAGIDLIDGILGLGQSKLIDLGIGKVAGAAVGEDLAVCRCNGLILDGFFLFLLFLLFFLFFLPGLFLLFFLFPGLFSLLRLCLLSLFLPGCLTPAAIKKGIRKRITFRTFFPPLSSSSS